MDFLKCAVETPDDFVAHYGPDTEIDGISYPSVFRHIATVDDVDPEDIFRQVFDESLGVFAEVDWKISNEEVYLFVDSMLRGYGHDRFDWSFEDEHDDGSTENYEFIAIIDKKLKGSGFRLVSFDPQSDSHAFAVVPDGQYRLICSIEPYY